MNGDLLLDANIITALFAADESILTRLQDSDSVFVSSIALGELYFGARKSIRVAASVARVDEFAARNAILDCDEHTTRHYGQIKGDLRTKGRPNPENDIWIAALAQQYHLTLVSRDSHFTDVSDMRLEMW